MMQSEVQTEALIYAAEGGALATVRAVLAEGADPNTRELTPFQCPVLACAANLGQTAVVRYLLDQGADVNARGPNGLTAIMLAVKRKDEEAIKFLIKRGADPDKKSDDGTTARIIAETKGPKRLAALL